MSDHILTHKHQTHNRAASGWRIHCGVEVTELSTNKQHSLSHPVTQGLPVLSLMMMSFICFCRNKNQPKVIYRKGTSHHTRLFTGSSTNDMKKYYHMQRYKNIIILEQMKILILKEHHKRMKHVLILTMMENMKKFT